MPLSSIALADIPIDLFTSVFLYRLAGIRCRRVMVFLKEQGDSNLKNIGGINSNIGQIKDGTDANRTKRGFYNE